MPDGHPMGRVEDANTVADRNRHAGVRHGGGMARQRLGAAEG
jgi:hypothetical protein